MADITLCSNNKCPIKELCYRFTCQPGRYQSYSHFEPDESGECEYLILPDSSQKNELEQIDKQLRGQQLVGHLWVQLRRQLRVQLSGQLYDQLWVYLVGQLSGQLRSRLCGNIRDQIEDMNRD